MLFRCLILAISLFTAACLQAQGLDMNLLKGLEIRNIGPAGMSGRVTALAVDEDHPEVMYAGTASGGLWKSEGGGLTWKPVFDQQSIQSIGAVAVDQRNPSIVWAGTGEGNPRNSQNSGKGIYRSPDAGRTWACMGLENTRTIHRIIVHPHNSDIVWAAALGSPWGPNPERGVFKTTNAGKTWDKVLHVNDTTGCADLIIDPANPDKLYAAMWQHQRQPWFFESGGSGSGLYVSLDGGTTWQKRNEKNGLPAGKLGRIGLAVCQSKPETVYALVEAQKTGLYRSDDGGMNWKLQSDKNIGNRPFYYAEIYVDPLNENRIYNLFSIVTVSEDAGKSFKPLLPWSSGIHPDHHAFYIHPKDPKFMIDGNDGGLGISRDQGKTWQFAGNIPVGQFYHVHYDMDTPYNVMGGMQDNGSYVGPSQVWAHDGIHNHHWREVVFGDGFGVMPHNGNKDLVYAMSQGGALNRVNKATGEAVYIKPVGQPGQKLRFNWNAPLAQHPTEPSTIYYGSQFVHKSTDGGDSWQVISPDLTTNDTTKQKQHKSGGITIDATAAENHTTLVCIQPSPIQAGQIWASSDDGKLHLTRDEGKTWTDLSNRLPGAPQGAWLPWVEASRHHPGEAFVVLNDYRRNNWAPYLYHTRDYGQTWRQLINGNGVNGHCLSLVQDPVVEGLLFLGTDQGLYVSTDAGAQWARWSKGFPAVPINSLKIHPRDHDLIIGTFGRALWILDDLQPLREIARKGPAFWNQSFDMVSASDAITAEYRSVDAGRFLGSGEFKGQNRRRGSIFSYYIPAPPPSEPTEGKGKGKEDNRPSDKPGDANKKGGGAKNPDKGRVRFHVLMGGDSIRTFSVKADTGLLRVAWGMDRDMPEYPSFSAPDPNADPPGGGMVMPGKYKVVAIYNGIKDSVEFTVSHDPRIPASREVLEAREANIRTFERGQATAAEAFARLREAKENLDRMDGILKIALPGVKDSLEKAGKVMQDSIRQLMGLFMNPENINYLDHVTHRLGKSMEEAEGYLHSNRMAAGPNAMLALANFQAELRVVVGRVNRFLERDWMAYQAKVVAAQTPLLKPLPPVRVD